MLKKFVAVSALCAIATPAHAISMLSLHAMPVTIASAQTNLVIVALAATALVGTLAYRIARN